MLDYAGASANAHTHTYVTEDDVYVTYTRDCGTMKRSAYNTCRTIAVTRSVVTTRRSRERSGRYHWNRSPGTYPLISPPMHDRVFASHRTFPGLFARVGFYGWNKFCFSLRAREEKLRSRAPLPSSTEFPGDCGRIPRRIRDDAKLVSWEYAFNVTRSTYFACVYMYTTQISREGWMSNRLLQNRSPINWSSHITISMCVCLFNCWAYKNSFQISTLTLTN